MGRIYRATPNAAARENNYRWQDDPNTGEFSEYGRSNHLAAALVTLIAMLLTLVAVAAWLWWMLQ